MAVLLPIGTRKGLFLVRSDDGKAWEVDGPLLPGWSVYHAIVDPRDGALHAATNNPFYGATTHRSDDRGKTSERAEVLRPPAEGDLKRDARWPLEAGAAPRPPLGGEP